MDSNLLLVSLQGLLSEISACQDDKQRDECDRLLVSYARDVSSLRLTPLGKQNQELVKAAQKRDTAVLEQYAKHSQHAPLREWAAELVAEILKSRGLPKPTCQGAAVDVV